MVLQQAVPLKKPNYHYAYKLLVIGHGNAATSFRNIGCWDFSDLTP